MKKALLFGVSLLFGAFSLHAQQLWDNFDGLPSPAITNYSYVDGGFGQVDFAFSNPNTTGNSSSLCLKYTKPAAQYQKIYMVPATGYSINNVSAFQSGSKSFSMKILNQAGTAVVVQIGLVDNSKSGGAWPAGRHSTYTATTSTSTDWQTLTFTYDNAVSEDATVGDNDVNEIIIEINGADGTGGDIYLLDDLMLAEVSSTTSLFSSTPSNNLFKLEQNVPNPFNFSTTISYKLNASSEVLLEIMDPLGNPVKTLVNEYLPAGEYSTELLSKDMKNGVYFCRLKSGKFVETIKIVLAE